MSRLVAAGVSGFLGSRLTAAATERGWEITRLVRRPPRAPDERRWDPDAGLLGASVLDGADAVVNLCGTSIQKRWTDSTRALIRSSRLKPTELLATTCAQVGVPVLVNASGVGYYGPRGDERVDESEPAGSTFVARLAADWEAATRPAADAGVRVVNLRTGLVLGSDGGLVPPVRLATLLFAGGRFGSGRQYYPWISVTDWVDAVLHLLRTPTVSGPVNLTGPEPVRNSEFTRAFGRALHRPTPWVIPGFALKVVLDGFAEEVLNGQRAIPTKLVGSGFVFSHATLDEALRAELD